eukprot:TRINITY_DN49205_c0_g1_i1.p2 TRINITY_DN49205_c0_g1~~TRINITY_DN49205_c0_g1_i1.p2  ORF type:complete len:145 (-),score=38.10 TRINITY_DN49205_c0_g1_i1:47-481(-)
MEAFIRFLLAVLLLSVEATVCTTGMESCKIFSLLDRNSSGSLDAAELRNLAHFLGLNPTGDEVKVFMLGPDIDQDGSGGLDPNELPLFSKKYFKDSSAWMARLQKLSEALEMKGVTEMLQRFNSHEAIEGQAKHLAKELHYGEL